MPILPHIAPCTHNTPCLEYPCRLANPPAAFAAPIMAGEDQPQAEANVAMSPLPEFFINTPTTWFQQAEARFAGARPALTSGQKYFQLLGRLPVPQDLMVNFTDIAQCTIAAARNNGDPYTDMKDAILQSTTKPKWSCYFDLHTLPPQGDSRPSQLKAKLISLMPTDAPTNTDLFYSFFLFRMPQSIREALAATDYPNARALAAAPSGTCGRPRRRPSPQPHPPETGPGPPTAATATAAATTIAAHHPAAAAAGGRHLTTTLRKTTTEFDGITTNSSANLTDAFPHATGRETACPPDETNAASGGDRRSKNRNSNVLFTWLRIIIFKR
jgi:hypothetical protein